MQKSTAELWVKIIAILGYIGAAFGVLLGILVMIGGGMIGTLLPMMGLEGLIGGALVGGLMIFAGIVAIGLGVFEFFVARGLWKHKNWARIVTVVFAGIGVVMNLVSIIGSPVGAIFGLIINGGIFYLLALNKDIVRLFK